MSQNVPNRWLCKCTKCHACIINSTMFSHILQAISDAQAKQIGNPKLQIVMRVKILKNSKQSTVL
jgi:hypothetical protein